MADAAEVVGALRADPPRPLPVFSALVPNERGFNAAAAFHSEQFPLKVSVFTAASETFSQKNTNASIAETLERFQAFVPRAIELGMQVRCYISCAISCPYEGPITPHRVRRVADALRRLAPEDAWSSGQVELDLGDTIGAGNTDSMRTLLAAFEVPERERLTLHLHDTFGRASECVRVGLALGVRSFDGATGGLGGCPYAGTPEQPAPGNISTERLVATIAAEGFECAVEPDRLREAGELAVRLAHDARAEAAS